MANIHLDSRVCSRENKYSSLLTFPHGKDVVLRKWISRRQTSDVTNPHLCDLFYGMILWQIPYFNNHGDPRQFVVVPRIRWPQIFESIRILTPQNYTNTQLTFTLLLFLGLRPTATRSSSSRSKPPPRPRPPSRAHPLRSGRPPCRGPALYPAPPWSEAGNGTCACSPLPSRRLAP